MILYYMYMVIEFPGSQSSTNISSQQKQSSTSNFADVFADRESDTSATSSAHSPAASATESDRSVISLSPTSLQGSNTQLITSPTPSESNQSATGSGTQPITSPLPPASVICSSSVHCFSARTGFTCSKSNRYFSAPTCSNGQ